MSKLCITIVCKCILSAILLHFISANTLQFVTRNQWNARTPSEVIQQTDIPIRKVIISHTATGECTNEVQCSKRVRSIQDYHMNERKFADIAYNFLIAGNGLIYEGRGWGGVGAHTKGQNNESIGIAFIGDFETIAPPTEQLNAAQLLLEDGVSIGILTPDYKLYGHKQFSATRSPGAVLYELIKSWPHWSPTV